MGIHRKQTVVLTRSAGASSGDEVISVGGMPKMVVIAAVDDGNQNVNCVGWDDGDICVVNYTTEVSFLTTLLGAIGVGSLSRNAFTSSMIIYNAGNGWSFKISALSTDGCTITWTKTGSGRAVTAKLLIIM